MSHSPNGRTPHRVAQHTAAALVLACAALVTERHPRAAPQFDAARFLREHVGFTTGHLARLDQGDTIARTLDAESSEVAIGAAVRMRIPAAFYVDRFRDIESFKRSEPVLQIGRFARTPSPADLQRLAVAQEDIEDLRRCRPGDCDVRLDAAGISRIASHAQEGSPDTAIAGALRQHLAEYAAAYMQRGNAALMEYRDQPDPVRVADQLKLILQRSEYLPRTFPELHETIAAFAGTPARDADHFLYWSHERVGPKSVITITHATIAPPRDGVTAVTTKQIYGSHYFTASLGLTLLVDASTAATGPQTLVIYINRSRVDVFGGLLGPVKRSLARSRARSGAESMLRHLGQRLERQFAAVRDGTAPGRFEGDGP